MVAAVVGPRPCTGATIITLLNNKNHKRSPNVYFWSKMAKQDSQQSAGFADATPISLLESMIITLLTTSDALATTRACCGPWGCAHRLVCVRARVRLLPTVQVLLRLRLGNTQGPHPVHLCPVHCHCMVIQLHLVVIVLSNKPHRLGGQGAALQRVHLAPLVGVGHGVWSQAVRRPREVVPATKQ